MTPTDAMDKLNTLQELIEPVATVTTDRLIREIYGFLWSLQDDEAKKMAQRAPETPPNE
jgi:hypothetical protein